MTLPTLTGGDAGESIGADAPFAEQYAGGGLALHLHIRGGRFRVATEVDQRDFCAVIERVTVPEQRGHLHVLECLDVDRPRAERHTGDIEGREFHGKDPVLVLVRDLPEDVERVALRIGGAVVRLEFLDECQRVLAEERERCVVAERLAARRDRERHLSSDPWVREVFARVGRILEGEPPRDEVERGPRVVGHVPDDRAEPIRSGFKLPFELEAGDVAASLRIELRGDSIRLSLLSEGVIASFEGAQVFYRPLALRTGGA